MTKISLIFELMLLPSLMVGKARADMQYLTPEQFFAEIFNTEAPKPKVLWLTKDILRQTEKILSHAPLQLRQRYWRIDDKSVWILDEVGKEELITAGFVVMAGEIYQARILTYRESRGGEVRYPAFLKQYQGVKLQDDYFLNRSIDGISGATLSVNAMNRMARLALYFDAVSQMETQ